MKILITGIAGLLGSSLAHFIQTMTDDDVVGIDDLSCGLESNIPRDVKCYHDTIGRQDNNCNQKGICDCIFAVERPDVVYHFAAYAAECLSPFIRMFNYRNNLVATAEVVNACINYGVERLVFTSSMAAYGDGDPPFEEDDWCRPIDSYGNAKLACERDIQIAGQQHGLPWTIIRPHNVYGPGQVITQTYRNVFGIWMWRHMHSESLRIYGDGSQQRAFSYVGDIVLPLYLAGQKPEASRQIINLGGSTPVTINQAAHMLCDVLGTGQGCIEYCQPRHEVHQAWCTVDKSHRLLGYQDRTTLSEGLGQMWQWAQRTEHGSGPAPTLEVEEGLPCYWAASSPRVS